MQRLRTGCHSSVGYAEFRVCIKFGIPIGTTSSGPTSTLENYILQTERHMVEAVVLHPGHHSARTPEGTGCGEI